MHHFELSAMNESCAILFAPERCYMPEYVSLSTWVGVLEVTNWHTGGTTEWVNPDVVVQFGFTLQPPPRLSLFAVGGHIPWFPSGS